MLIGGVVATLSFLPGCALLDMFKGGSEAAVKENRALGDGYAGMTGEVLVSLRGKPVITTDILAIEKEKFFKAHPQMVEVLRHMNSKEFDRNLLEGLIGQCIADEHVISKEINQLDQYKAELKEIHKAMESMLNAKLFNESIVVNVPESEVKSFYETNKGKLRGVALSQGGVAAMGLEFADAAAARAFVGKAKMPQSNFAKAAQEAGLTAKIKDFKLVNGQSIGMDEMLRDKIVAIKTVPSLEVIEANGAFWVVSATTKEEPTYIPYEQIKDKLRQELEQSKRVEVLEKKINELRKEYDVTVNEEYFKGNEAEQATAAARGGLANAADTQEPVSKRLA